MSITTDQSPKKEKLGTPDARYDTTPGVNNEIQEEIERVDTKNQEISSHDLDSDKEDYIVRE